MPVRSALTLLICWYFVNNMKIYDGSGIRTFEPDAQVATAPRIYPKYHDIDRLGAQSVQAIDFWQSAPRIM